MKKKYLVVLPAFFCLSLSACAESDIKGSKTIEPKEDRFALVRTKVIHSEAIDIDGDQKTDVVETVTLKKGIHGVPASVAVASPWEPTSTEEESQSQKGSHNNIFVTFGNSKQFLIHDRNEFSILDTEAAEEIHVVAHETLKELDFPDLLEQAKGDVIVIPTEAGIDTYLYWDGISFQSYEPMELP